MWLGLSSLLPLALLRFFNEQPDQATVGTAPPLIFELRHEHGISPTTNRVVFADVPTHSASVYAFQNSGLGVKTRPTKIYRPSSQDEFQAARIRSFKFGQTAQLGWDEDEVPGPDVKDRETLILLAKMTNNAYLNPGDAEWYDLGDGWNAVLKNPCKPTHQFSFDRTILLVGSLTLTGFADMSLLRPITAQLSSRSRARLLVYLAAAAPQQRRTNSMITYYSRAAVLALI
jgi:hypothetical protein